VHSNSIRKGKDIELDNDIKHLCENLYNRLNYYYYRNRNN